MDINANLIGSVPENVYGVGAGINLIYHEVGWDNHPNCRDTSAIMINDHGGYEFLINEVLLQDAFLIGNTMAFDLNLQEDIFAIDGSYKLMAIYDVCGYKYAYYLR